MQAKCPRCSAVFETARVGVQFCPTCGQQVNVAEVGASAPPADPAALPVNATKGPKERQPTPWERRKELGLWPAAWLTWKQLLLEPENFWSALEPRAPWQDALWYGWLIAAGQVLLDLPFRFLMSGQVQGQLAQLEKAGVKIPPEVLHWVVSLTSGTGAVALEVGRFVLYPVSLFIGAGLLHLFALLFGAGKNGFGATVRIVAYASGPLVLAGIPCVGGGVALYVIVLEVWGLMRVQETTLGRAIATLLALPVLLGCCLCGVGVLVAKSLLR